MTSNRTSTTAGWVEVLGGCIAILLAAGLLTVAAASLASLVAWGIVSLWPGLSPVPVASLVFVVILLLFPRGR